MSDTTQPDFDAVKPCNHVVVDKDECDHGTEPPYTSICSVCGPDYGCKHAGIRKNDD